MIEERVNVFQPSGYGGLIREPSAMGPLLVDDAGTVSHVWFKGGLVDTKGNNWTANGSIPMVPKAGKTPAGAGPFGFPTPHYSLANPNVLQFAGDFSMAIVFAPGTFAAQRTLASTWSTPSTGWVLSAIATTGVLQLYTSAGSSTANAALAGLNVVCAGRTGGNNLVKVNLGALASAAGTYAAGTNLARLGARGDAFPFDGTLYEAWFSTTTPTDALFIEIMNRAKTRAGVTAW